MDKIVFTVPGAPAGKARARTVKNKYTGQTMSFTPESTILYENLIKNCYMQASAYIFNNKEPLRLCINAYFAPPASASKKRCGAMLTGNERPVKKPDADNIAKTVCDALNGLAYGDDTQICQLIVNKTYAAVARLEVEIEPIITGE